MARPGNSAYTLGLSLCGNVMKQGAWKKKRKQYILHQIMVYKIKSTKRKIRKQYILDNELVHKIKSPKESGLCLCRCYSLHHVVTGIGSIFGIRGLKYSWGLTLCQIELYVNMFSLSRLPLEDNY